jgi:transposase
MDVIIERCAGLDVHKRTVAACVRSPGAGRTRRRSETKTFGTFEHELAELRSWLVAEGVTAVAMEATGVYWKPILYALEADFDLLLVNATHVKKVPGRKTDVADAEWLARLLECGLLRGSFVPPEPIRDLRDLTRYRKRLIQDRGRESQRLEKVLEDAGIKLAAVATSTLGVSVRAMLDALIAGERNPEALAELAKGRLRGKLPQLRLALSPTRFRPHHALMLAEHLAHIDHLSASINRLDERIDEVIAPFADARDRLMTIPAVAKTAAEVIIAECGVDMARFPTAAHLASWAGMCPGNNESAGKHRSGHTSGVTPGWLGFSPSAAGRRATRKTPTWLPTSGTSPAAGVPSEPRSPLATPSW